VMGHPEPDEFVDITSQIDRKIAALLCHESQHRDPSGMVERVREWNSETAQVAGFGVNRFAEAFTVVNTR